MTCPVCGGKTTVTYCYADCETVQRRRRCLDCRHVFYTAEQESTHYRYHELQSEDRRKRHLKKLVREAKNAQSN